ncbi:MAG: DUF559 domain-containing protein [Lysobacterales bacterium]
MLWQHLRDRRLLGFKFRRQHRVGPYFADFACVEARVIIELDGSQHLDQSTYDQARTAHLEAEGYRVLRVWNNELTANLQGVLEAIVALVTAPHPPSGHPLPASGERVSLRQQALPSPRLRGEGAEGG